MFKITFGYRRRFFKSAFVATLPCTADSLGNFSFTFPLCSISSRQVLTAADYVIIPAKNLPGDINIFSMFFWFFDIYPTFIFKNFYNE